ncbi:hypothetical protein OE88DRAFT_1072003 [Heliocybe sulcata]|uniref:Uncharacterized protein n=1 Tax=Heliocybe sulcata TaxID=5364 RepID=A0A5C3MNH8_9AGAM|nr:hypothetical protein OE88DRAFT_1072003 [Heliocybe sulcata]
MQLQLKSMTNVDVGCPRCSCWVSLTGYLCRLYLRIHYHAPFILLKIGFIMRPVSRPSYVVCGASTVGTPRCAGTFDFISSCRHIPEIGCCPEFRSNLHKVLLGGAPRIAVSPGTRRF